MAYTQRGYLSTLVQQTGALLIRDFLIAVRNWPATLLRLGAALFFLFVLWLSDVAIQRDSEDLDQFKDIRSAEPEAITPIPSCEDDQYSKSPCWDFLYTPNNPSVTDLVTAIRVNNPGREIPEDKVKGFATHEEANQWMLDNIDSTIAALHFDLDMDNQFVGYTIQTNATVKVFRSQFQDFNTFVQLPLQQAVGREATKLLMKDGVPDDFDYRIRIAPFPHPPSDPFSLVGEVIPLFLFAANKFAFVAQLYALVQEKEQGYKQALVSMGLMDSARILAFLLFQGAFVFLSSVCMTGFGYIFNFQLYTQNPAGQLLVTFFLFQLAMTSFAVFLGPFIRRAVVSIFIGFVIFILGWIMQIVASTQYVYDPKYYYWKGGVMPIIFSLFPWSLFSKSLNDLGTAGVQKQGIDFEHRFSYCKNFADDKAGALAYQATYPDNLYLDTECVMPLGDAQLIMFAQAVAYLLLGLYLDNVIPNEKGVSRPPWFFLVPSYWYPRKSRTFRVAAPPPLVGKPRPVAESSEVAPSTSNEAQDPSRSGAEDPDVVAEREKLLNANQVPDGEHYPIEVLGLSKQFGKYHAVDKVWWSLPSGQVLALLGPNGAGKTTTINCLTGVLPLSGGDAIMQGQQLSTPGGLWAIRRAMGICPQFDVLWGELTGMEHVQLFGRIKGLGGKAVNEEAMELLTKVRLEDAARQRVGSYSGGMKRRLSVSLALLGNPQIVFLDEPTTGMDPIARRYVWDVVDEMKPGRVVVLTTHSMEEADVLGDKVAIMARGKLRCLATSLRLKQRFGTGYHMVISVEADRSNGDLSTASTPATDALIRFIHDNLWLAPKSTAGTFVEYQVPREKEQLLPHVLKELDARKAELRVADVQVSLTTLEDVFLGIAKKAEIEAAEQAGGQYKTVTLAGTGRQTRFLKVPLGIEEVQDANTGVRYTARWQADEEGRLQLFQVDISPGQANVPQEAHVLYIET